MKRVLCLYRVSTLKQVDKKDDNKIFLCGILPLISDVTSITILHPFTSVPWIDDFI